MSIFKKYLEAANKSGNQRGMKHKEAMAEVNADMKKNPFDARFWGDAKDSKLGSGAKDEEKKYRKLIKELQDEGKSISVDTVNTKFKKTFGRLPSLSRRDTQYAIDYILKK